MEESILDTTASVRREAPLRVLTMTTLFPSVASPRHGIFVETRLRKLRALAPIDLRVVAPVPWFPLTWSGFGRYAAYAATPRSEQREGVDVRHPRFVSIPRVGMSIQPAALAATAIGAARELEAEGWSCDVIDVHYLYPDGVAAAVLARRLGKPFVVTARGSDVNLIAQMPGPRQRILGALAAAEKVIAVSVALKEALISLGVPSARIEVLRNGVDTDLFAPRGRDETRRRLGVGDAPMVASVGNLVVEKGHDLVLRAAHVVQGVRVVFVGRGPERVRLERIAGELGMSDRVSFVDNLPQRELASIYTAADALALGSQREGWPNVLLEAMACGTPVVATDVGGVREIVAQPIAGETVAARDESSFGAALRRVLGRKSERSAVRAYAAQFAWEPIVERYRDILATAARSRKPQLVGGV